MIQRNHGNKIVLLGSASVGKTALVLRWTQSKFSQSSQPTVGACYVQRRFVYNDSEEWIQIWDTAGEERYRSMAPIYAAGAIGAVIVADLTRPETLEDVETWIESLERPGKIPFILVGNKCDLLEDRKINREAAVEKANELGVEYFETSAYTGEGVDTAFEGIARKALDERSRIKKFDTSPIEEANPEQKQCC